ncbi:pseudouridylate synthase 7 homolog isoform X2 [Pomacea canaliculata]|uniref:pseudouridylate synthase 7 homolog isoform X2 n=1 Tax=Pomacea canaliculata TaxID=400727 RepID=UPI000D73A058|nr:pseudouridylate synthase 7 homolog isoform X2 [Pomacea canaliculata]
MRSSISRRESARDYLSREVTLSYFSVVTSLSSNLFHLLVLPADLCFTHTDMSDSPNNFPPAKKQKLTTNDGAIGVDGDAHEVILSTGNGFPTESEHCVKQPVISTESTVELISTVAEHENTTQNSTLTCKEKQNDGLQLRTDDIQDQSNKIHLGTNVSELDVGITEFLCNHPGISAIIKQRYSDFTVHEVSLTGKTIHLTSTELPSEEPEMLQESIILKI